MTMPTAESLLYALRVSGLLTPEQVDRLAGELAALGDDPQVLCRYLIEHHRIPVYQLRKVIHGKTAELFIGPYIVLDKLGEGGMGKVYKARDSRSGRVVALKVIRPQLLSNPLIRGRYGREVQTALALNHPNIAAAYESGESGDRHYLALEFVDGVDLARLVRSQGVLSVPEACEYLRQASLGLQHAHDEGFVHRDIKPSNIVVSGERHHRSATEPARVKILDMGLVRSVGFEESPGGTDLTRDGTVVGTPDYMAPEQAKNSSTVDHRADLYSIGAAFYFLLTGKPPFSGGSPIEKILKHQLDPPPPLQAIRPDVPDELARIVSRLMSKKPTDRFPTARDVAEALARLTQFTEAVPDQIVPVFALPEGVSAETLPHSSPTVPPLPSHSLTGEKSTVGDLRAEAVPERRPSPSVSTPPPREDSDPVRRHPVPRTRNPAQASPSGWQWVFLAGILLLGALTLLAVAAMTWITWKG